MRALLVHNPQAGSGKHTEDDLMAALRQGGLTPSYCSTKGGDFPHALAQVTDCYVAAGGDGTIADVVENLPDRGRPVGLLPLGTANNVARAFAVSGSPKEIAGRLAATTLQRLDIGVARGPWGQHRFVEAVGIGAVALAIADKLPRDDSPIAEKIRRGREELVRILRDMAPIELEVMIDDIPLSGRYMAVEIMNTPSSGPALPLAPTADPGDGWLDVVLVGEEDRDRFIQWAGAQRPGPPNFGRTQRARSVTLSWKEALPLRIDDERPEIAGPGRAKIEIEPVPALIMALAHAPAETRGEDELVRAG